MSRMDGSDAERVAQALAGDRDAFRVLVEHHSRSIFRLAYRMTGNEHDAEEVVQETFLKAYRRLNRFESRSNFGTWLYRIGVNCALDLMRKRRSDAERRDSDAPEGSEAVRELPSAELGRQVAKALGALSPTERAAFLLRYFEGQSIEEIGQALGLRTSATKNSVFRAVQKLRRALEPFVQVKPNVAASRAPSPNQ